MSTLPRSKIFIFVCSLVLVSLLFALLAPPPARADVGPEPILPDGSSLKPEGETPIEMRAETVILTIRKATEADNTVVDADLQEYFYGSPAWFPAVAEVQAEFRMKNPTSEDVSMTVWFPLASFIKTEEEYSGVVPAIRRFQVMVDGKEVDYSVRDLPHPRGGDRPPLPWANFPITFPAKERVWIQVSYILPAQRPGTASSPPAPAPSPATGSKPACFANDIKFS